MTMDYKMPREFLTDSDDATIALGRSLAVDVSAPLVILLMGDMGAGKTTFSKGLISGLARRARKISPVQRSRWCISMEASITWTCTVSTRAVTSILWDSTTLSTKTLS